MKRTTRSLIRVVLGVCVLALTAVPMTLWAQDAGDGNTEGARRQRPARGEAGERPARGEGGEERQRMDPAKMMAQFAERRLESTKTELGASDDEWEVLKPMVQKVMDKQNEERRFTVRQVRGGGRFGQQETEEIKEVKELREALADESTSADVLKAKLDAFRAVRDKSEQELKEAQEALKKVLTVRQEAVLVGQGLLD